MSFPANVHNLRVWDGQTMSEATRSAQIGGCGFAIFIAITVLSVPIVLALTIPQNSVMVRRVVGISIASCWVVTLVTTSVHGHDGLDARIQEGLRKALSRPDHPHFEDHWRYLARTGTTRTVPNLPLPQDRVLLHEIVIWGGPHGVIQRTWPERNRQLLVEDLVENSQLRQDFLDKPEKWQAIWEQLAPGVARYRPNAELEQMQELYPQADADLQNRLRCLFMESICQRLQECRPDSETEVLEGLGQSMGQLQGTEEELRALIHPLLEQVARQAEAAALLPPGADSADMRAVRVIQDAALDRPAYRIIRSWMQTRFEEQLRTVNTRRAQLESELGDVIATRNRLQAVYYAAR
jgi:hypothetical protein